MGELSAAKNIWVQLATAGGLGLLPRAPGTFGSLPGLLLGPVIQILFMRRASDTSWGLFRFWESYYLVLTVVLSIALVAWYVIHLAEKRWMKHDDQRIVIDEVVGQTLALSFCHPDFVSLVMGFVLFRLFDILKPGPIGWADKKLPGALGTLLDDVFAGLVTAALLPLLDDIWT